MGQEQPSTPISITPSGAWGVIKDALQTGQVGTIIGTVALAMIALQYMGFIKSPVQEAHDTFAQQLVSLNANVITSSKSLMEVKNKQFEIADAMWGLCFTQAETPEDKAICKEGMLKQRN